MDLKRISIGINPPQDVNVIVEIPLGGPSIKYEIDKESGALFVNRVLNTAMYYPVNYGFIPHTLASDGDPLDALVLGNVPILPCAVIPCQPLGVLLMEDENGLDEKILLKPNQKIDPSYLYAKDIHDVPESILNQLSHFFGHYKDLDNGKWVKVHHWANAQEACRIIQQYKKEV